MLMYMCAKFGACITKCTLLLNIWAKLPHYYVSNYVLLLSSVADVTQH